MGCIMVLEKGFVDEDTASLNRPLVHQEQPLGRSGRSNTLPTRLASDQDGDTSGPPALLSYDSAFHRLFPTWEAWKFTKTLSYYVVSGSSVRARPKKVTS